MELRQKAENLLFTFDQMNYPEIPKNYFVISANVFPSEWEIICNSEMKYSAGQLSFLLCIQRIVDNLDNEAKDFWARMFLGFLPRNHAHALEYKKILDNPSVLLDDNKDEFALFVVDLLEGSCELISNCSRMTLAKILSWAFNSTFNHPANPNCIDHLLKGMVAMNIFKK